MNLFDDIGKSVFTLTICTVFPPLSWEEAKSWIFRRKWWVFTFEDNCVQVEDSA